MDPLDRLCFICQRLDLEAILGPDTFAELPPTGTQESGVLPVSDYLRPIIKYTLAGVGDSASDCTFCSFLYRMGLRAEKNPAEHAITGSTGVEAAILADGFVLVAIPESLAYIHCDESDRRIDGSNVFLMVLYGLDSIERVEDYARRYSVPFPVCISAHYIIEHAARTGTLVSRALDRTKDPTPSVQYCPVDRTVADCEHLRSWIDMCIASHGACNSRRHSSNPVPRMRVIDCASRKIVEPEPGKSYAALSYVWGTSPPDSYLYPNLPDRVPRVIEDAMALTIKLGIPYLWVDRYCIWQDDPSQTHKMEQINAMGDIYGGAIVTLVSNADDITHGMAGVSVERSLSPQIVGTFKAMTLVADGDAPWTYWDAIHSSTWHTRGWTLQEWVLSPRVLILSPSRVSYECAGMNCIEGFNWPLGIGTAKRLRPSLHLEYSSGATTLLQTFSRRKLTYEADALDALAGVLQMWMAANPGASHLMGVPFTLSPPKAVTTKTQFEAFWEGLSWLLPRERVDFVERPPKRPGLPTWSPISVRGASIEYSQGHHNLPPIWPTLQGEAKFELRGGSIHSLEDMLQAELHRKACRSVVALLLSGWCFEPRNFTKGEASKWFCRVSADADSSVMLEFLPDEDGRTLSIDEARESRFVAISPYGAREEYHAILCERGDRGHEAKRVGIVVLYKTWDPDSIWLNPRKTLHTRWDTIRLV